ncbi:tetratricopeptide repeat protein 12 isoform X3 [Pezoporus flaviventris]|uniref:tetratricopeptide repeat protein 12 isoform X3 n=1 Tax=Pezoporus flaviventris TaxID=889875 RepID=UPI002AAFA89B|nr:tetratricopeptide repeat protein 12 isoform X3 [Pezoporus flaviventris]
MAASETPPFICMATPQPLTLRQGRSLHGNGRGAARRGARWLRSPKLGPQSPAMVGDEEQERDFQRFLRRVDDIANLVQGLSSPDSAVNAKAIAEAEKRLHDQETNKEEESKTTVNRTVINTRASDVANAEAVNADGFLAMLEKDAKERAKQRKRNEHLANDCMNEVNLEEKRMRDEERAMKEVESGNLAALSIKELLQKLHRPDQNVLYYAGGIRLLAGTVKDCTEQTLFRTNNGFSILGDNEIVRGGFCAESKNAAEVDLSVSLLLLWQAVCAGNEENQRLLLTHPDVSAQLPKLLSSGVSEIQKETLALIYLYSENENGRRLLVRHLDLTKWLQVLMMFVNSTDAKASSAMDILSDLTQEERFKTQCRVMLSTDVLPLFTQLLTSAKLVNQAALARCIGIMGNLCADGVIRMQMAECKECWQACLKLVDEYFDVSTSKYQQCLFAVLGLMMNLLLESNVIIQYFAVDISGRCVSLLRDKDGRIVTRATGVLSRILPASSSAVEEVVKGGVVKKMIKFLKAGGETTCNYGIKTLSICTRSNRQAQEDLVKSDKGFSVLLKLLDSENEMIVGNAALCLGQCLVVPGAATSLLNSNVVMILLKHAGGNARRTSVQENAAIALGKLCVAEPRHIFQLRKLNGLAILSSSMKYVQSI